MKREIRVDIDCGGDEMRIFAGVGRSTVTLDGETWNVLGRAIILQWT